MIRHDWPGNVRELMNTIERAVVLGRDAFLQESDMPMIPSRETPEEMIPGDNFSLSGEMPLAEIERAAIVKTLTLTEGNKSETARRLGITRKTLHKKLRSYGMM
jgi:two-component system response regulator HydG